MLEYKTLLRQLCGIMSISGCEREAASEVKSLVGGYFDSVTVDSARNIILCKKSTKRAENVQKIILDAHFDEVGMIVTDITDEGLLHVHQVGGLDRSILPASEVWVYGAEKLYGVVTSTPPHLAKPGDTKAPEWNDILIDIGYPKEKAEKLAPIGTPVGYYYSGDDLLSDRITGRGFDDKACAAALICAAANTPAEELEYDIYVTLSAGEEVGGGGVKCAAYTIEPEFAVVTDVNFAKTPGVSDTEGGKFGAGPMISLSAVTDRPLTKKIIASAKANDIPYTPVVEPTNTGTNATTLVFSREGIPTAVVSLPLGGMHSYSETLSLTDAEYFIKLITLIVKGALNG